MQACVFICKQFSPERRQKFREATAAAVNSYCGLTTCDLLLSSGETQMQVMIAYYTFFYAKNNYRLFCAD